MDRYKTVIRALMASSLLAVSTLAWSGCRASHPQTGVQQIEPGAAQQIEPGAAQQIEPGAVQPLEPGAAQPPESVTLKILATGDVHGWLLPKIKEAEGRYEGGLDALAVAWRTQEGYVPEGHRTSSRRDTLILDSGDMWTGPPESTLTRGAPVVEAYNALGYDVAVVGNHEFDFGLEVLRQNARATAFPLLCANIVSKGAMGREMSGMDAMSATSGASPTGGTTVTKSAGGGDQGPAAVDFCRPDARFDIGGLQVGVIGLSCIETPHTTLPSNVEGLEFQAYIPTVRTHARRLLDDGVRVLIVMIHDGFPALKEVAEATQDLPIRLFLGGHTHEAELEVLDRDPATRADDVILLNARSTARVYGRVTLTFESGELVAHSEALVPVGGVLGDQPRRTDPTVSAIARRAREKVGPILEEVVGHASATMEVGSAEFSPLGQVVAESWLDQFPEADFSITNLGGLRQPLDVGDVTVGDILGVLPFTNNLLIVRITPEELRRVLENPQFILGGGRFHYRQDGSGRVVTSIEGKDGRPLEEGRRYAVVTTDFLYAGGDSAPFREMDPDPKWLGVNWRDPVLRYFRHRGEYGVVAPSVAPGIPL